ncbi:MAG: glycosyltransferase family 9 protein, partial [Phycisphaerae bacterium]
MRRVLMLHAGALGDCILALQIAAAVRRRFDGVTLDLVARSEAGPVAANWGLIDTLYSPEQFGLHWLFGDDALPKTLMERFDGYDGVLNLLGGLDEAVSERLRQACAGAVFCVAPAPAPARGGWHIVEQWLATLASQGLALKSSEQALHTPDDQERLA